MASDTESDATIHDLPVEILSKIFSFLKIKHRKNASLVCTKWRNATRCPLFYRKLRLYQGLYLDEPPISLFKKSYHPFSVIIFECIEYFPRDVAVFWREVSESVRELVFTSCHGLTLNVLDALLKDLNNVNKIKIDGTNGIEGVKPLKNYEKIKTLDLSDTEMSFCLIKSLVSCFPNLQELQLGTYTYDGWESDVAATRNSDLNARTSAFGDWIKDLCSLVPKVTLAYDDPIVRNTETIMKEILEIPNLHLTSINVEVNPVSEKIMKKFMETKGDEIRTLDIADTPFLKEKHFELLNKHCKHLKNLWLGFLEPCSTEVLEKLSAIKTLEKCSISCAQNEYFELNLTSKKLQLDKMRTLSVHKARFDTNLETFELTLSSMPYLTNLNFSNCKVSTASMQIIFKVCKTLEQLHLECGEEITDEMLFSDPDACLNSLSHLEVLNLNECYNVTNVSLKQIKLAEICKIGLRNMAGISSEGIKELCLNCPTIEQLDLYNCLIDDDCVQFISENLPNLKDIDLTASNITVKALDFIANNCKNIKNVNISDLPVTNSKGASSLLQKRILHLLSFVVMNNVTEMLENPN